MINIIIFDVDIINTYQYIYTVRSRYTGTIGNEELCRYIDLAENKEYTKKNIKYYIYYNGIK